MATRNDITGDLIKTKVTKSKEYENNYDAIFRKKEVDKHAGYETFELGFDLATSIPSPDQPVEPAQMELWTDEEERRLEIIGQNGNVGYGSPDIEAVSSDATQASEAAQD